MSDAPEDSALAKDAEPARNPKLAGVLVRVAVVAEGSGDYATAARLYRRAHTLDPDNGEIPLSLGRALLATHDYAGAVDAFRVVLSGDSSNAEAQRGLGVSLFTLGRYDEALPALRAAASRRGDDRVLRDLAISYDISGKSKDAQNVYRRAMERHPDDPTLRAHLALSHALNGEPDMVAPLLDPVAGNAILTPHDRRVMAAAYELSGDTHKARQLLRQDYDAADTDRAFADFENARTLAPSNPGLAYALIFDPERSASDANVEIAQLRQSPERANVAENSASNSVFRPATPRQAEPGVDAAASQPWDQIASDDASSEAATAPVQIADVSGTFTNHRRERDARIAAAGGYHVQLGAYRTESRAEKGWALLQRKAPEELGGVGHIVVADQRPDGRPTLYQLRTTPYSDRRQAAELCQQLKAKSLDCFVLRSRGVPITDPVMASVTDGDQDTPQAAPDSRKRRGSAERTPVQVADASPAGQTVVDGAGDHQYQVQLAAYHTLERAQRGWSILNRAAPDVLNNLNHVVVTPTDLPEATPLFRLRTREFAERPPADTVCSDLRTRKLDCLVVQTRLRSAGSNLMAEAPRPVEKPRKAQKAQKARKADTAHKKGDKSSSTATANITPSDTVPPVATPDVSPVDTTGVPPKPAPVETAATPKEPEPAPVPEPSAVADDSSGREQDRTGYSVQLAAYKTERLATNAWKQFQKKAPDLLGKLRPVIAAPDGSAGGNLYRLRAATFEERAVADAMCYELKARKLDCLVVQSRLAGHDLAQFEGAKDGVAPQTSESIDAPSPPRP